MESKSGSDNRIPKLSIVAPKSDSDSNISSTSFKRWHRYMQTQHMRSQRSSFSTWRICYKLCQPCRWFDSIDYEKKICKCCLTFRTFKTLGTIFLLAIYFYVYMFSILRDDVLPGGTTFFLFLLFLAAYVSGYVITLVGLPPMIAHLIIGIVFEYIPLDSILTRNNDFIQKFGFLAEKILLGIALIRAGLLLDVSRIKRHVPFIIQLSLLPLSCEFLIIWTLSHFLLKLPWDWSALQGSVTSVVSLASVTSVMEKNKQNGYGEDKNLCSVLIAAAVLNVVFGLLLYVMSLTYLLPEEGQFPPGWKTLVTILKQITLGVAVGGVSGLLVSFFPDKRNTETAAIRILVIGVGSIAICNVFYEFQMPVTAVIGCLTLCATAANMWEELGWHKDNNPVQYFYSMAYYFGQPVALSLVGYTTDFSAIDKKEIGLSIAVLLIGLAGKELTCFFTATSKAYPTSIKERIFICTAFFSKGTFQVLLVFAAKYLLLKQHKYLNKTTLEDYLYYARRVKETTVVAIILTTPMVYLALNLLTPVLLTRTEPTFPERAAQNRMRKRTSTIRSFIQIE